MLWLLLIGGVVLFFLCFNVKRVLVVPSFTSGQNYDVHPRDLTCSCPDFKKRRKSFSKDDPRRLCKHMISVTDKLTLPHYNLHQQALLEACESAGCGFPLSSDPQIIKTQSGVAVATEGEYPWVSVATGKKRYGYNVESYVWSSWGTPPDSDVIVRSLLNIPDELPDGSIKTIRYGKPEKHKRRVFGECHGVEFSLVINLRANWQEAIIDDFYIKFNRLQGVSKDLPPNLKPLVGAIEYWFDEEWDIWLEEYELVKKQKKVG